MRSIQNHQANNKNIGWGIALVAIVWLLSPVANAQSDTDLLEAVRACQRVPGLSTRLACYDRALPPMTESPEGRVATVTAAAPAPSPSLTPSATPTPTAAPTAAPTPTATPEPEPAPEPARVPARQPAPPLDPIVQIVEVNKPSLRTTRFHAVDGRVFVESDATVIHRWPEVPFEVEVQIGTFGGTFLKFVGRNLRIRVAVAGE